MTTTTTSSFWCFSVHVCDLPEKYETLKEEYKGKKNLGKVKGGS